LPKGRIALVIDCDQRASSTGASFAALISFGDRRRTWGPSPHPAILAQKDSVLSRESSMQELISTLPSPPDSFLLIYLEAPGGVFDAS
jgi:hypothetical protein